MKFSEQWLREWVNPPVTTEQLCEQLTLAGLEVDSVTPVAASFTQIVVGQVQQVEPHPDAKKLQICKVNIRANKSLTIVCGAPNVKPGMKVPTALVGASLGEIKITKTTLRGVASEGMLCSASELGLVETSEGLYELPQDAPVGSNFRDYLNLDDVCIDVELTPNRGDCLGVVGIAREVAVLNQIEAIQPSAQKVEAEIDEQLTIELGAPDDCPRYVGRIIKDINADATTPIWMQERLRRSGIRPIHPVVDVTNFVLLEFGHPMHAFDLKQISAGIIVRHADSKEKMTLIDGKEVELNTQTLVIADHEKTLAIAGIMGGEGSSVTDKTRDIFLESAYFNPISIAKSSRFYSLHTDASHRYERGVDYGLQVTAIERATALLLEIVGGKAGPVVEAIAKKHMPKPAIINLRQHRVNKIIGMPIPAKQVETILSHLGMEVSKQEEGWRVKTPTYRFDMTIEEDLIEEVARITGLDNIPSQSQSLTQQAKTLSEEKIPLSRLQFCLADRGYREVINYSFVDPALQCLLFPEQQAETLVNPIASDLAQMRVSLWPDLLTTLQYNQHRQQTRIRLFEVGLCFNHEDNQLQQQVRISGIASGLALPEQWGDKARQVDFYDIKADVEALCATTRSLDSFDFLPTDIPALHPGRSAKIVRDNKLVGYIGALHPSIEAHLDLQNPVYLFELDLDELVHAKIAKENALSKFPSIRRDIALIIDQAVPSRKIIDIVIQAAGKLLVKCVIFDVYQGTGIEEGKKSVALGLILQHVSRTLTDAEVNSVMETVINSLKKEVNAVLRA